MFMYNAYCIPIVYNHIDNIYIIVYYCISIYYPMTYVDIYMHIFTTINIFHVQIKLYEITYYIISYNLYDYELLRFCKCNYAYCEYYK